MRRAAALLRSQIRAWCVCQSVIVQMAVVHNVRNSRHLGEVAVRSRFGNYVALRPGLWLPDRTVAVVAGTELPSSALGALPGPGPVLELTASGAAIDGTPLPGATDAERATHLGERSSSTLGAAATDSAGGAAATKEAHAAFYVAASGDTDVKTLRAYLTRLPANLDLRLLVRMPAPPVRDVRARPDASVNDPATPLLLERDPEACRQIAERSYAELARCPAVSTAVSSVRRLAVRERWPALKSALRAALPRCDCGSVDTARLQSLVAAEQQGGAGAIGFLPISFLRDERWHPQRAQ